MPQIRHRGRLGAPVELRKVQEHERLHDLAEIRRAHEARDRSAPAAGGAMSDLSNGTGRLDCEHGGTPCKRTSYAAASRACVLTAWTSSSMSTRSPTSTPPASSTWFHWRPKS